jgi:hypothetical protein
VKQQKENGKTQAHCASSGELKFSSAIQLKEYFTVMLLNDFFAQRRAFPFSPRKRFFHCLKFLQFGSA